MLTNTTIVIKDACILFDLIDLELYDDFYALELTAITTSLVVSEIISENQSSIVHSSISSKKLIVISDGDLSVIQSIQNDNPGLSLADSSILELAPRYPGIILSSDKSLWNEAKRRNLTVKGVLWVVNQLYEKGVLSKAACLAKLELYPKINRRAPIRDIQMLIDKVNES